MMRFVGKFSTSSTSPQNFSFYLILFMEILIFKLWDQNMHWKTQSNDHEPPQHFRLAVQLLRPWEAQCEAWKGYHLPPSPQWPSSLGLPSWETSNGTSCVVWSCGGTIKLVLRKKLSYEACTVWCFDHPSLWKLTLKLIE